MDAEGVRARLLAMAKSLSHELGIKLVDEEDGLILQSIAFAEASQAGSGFTAVDLGAGVGYSTLWIAYGIADSGVGDAKLVAVEYHHQRAEQLRRILSIAHLGTPMIEVIESEALSYLESLTDNSLNMAFVDIEKRDYTRALIILERKLKARGIAIFHNAYTPPPPQSFFEYIRTGPWQSTIIPTPQGIALVRKID